MDNPGIKLGLAQDFGYNQRTADLARQNHEMRQAQIYKEAKTKMMAGDFDYNNAMNAWDNQAVKSFAQTKLKELGQFMRENPDWQTNLDKRIVYNNLTKELKDNKALNEGLQVDGNIKAMQAWAQDPKNADIVQSEDFAPIKQAYENYLRTGSTDGITENRKLFTFTPPEERVDTTPTYAKYAAEASANGQNTKWLANGAAAIHQFVTDEDKLKAAEGVLMDQKFGRYAKREYNEYLSTLPEGVKPLTAKQYALKKMEPYFKGDEYKNFSYQTKQKDSSGSGKDVGSQRNYLNEVANRAKSAPGQLVAADPDGLNQYLTGGRNVLNTSQMLFEKSPGNFIPIKGGIINDYTTSGTTARWDPKLGLQMSVLVNVPVEDGSNLNEFEDFIGEGAVDFGPFWISDNIKKGFDNNAKITKDKDGNSVVQTKLWVPVESSNTNTNASYNFGMHAKPEEVSSEALISSENSFQTPDGVSWTVGADGNYHGNNGQVVSPSGQRLK